MFGLFLIADSNFLYNYLIKATTTFEGKVAAIDETFDALCDTGKCFGMPYRLFESQLDENRNFTFSFTIQSLK